MKTTNYFNTFIQVAEDCPVAAAEVPLQKGKERTAATIQFETLYHHPYHYTSDDVLFHAFAEKSQLAGQELAEARENFFAKGQPCFRASPLTKRYGWGVHSNAAGKVAIYARESEEYQNLSQDSSLKQVKAMRSKRG